MLIAWGQKSLYGNIKLAFYSTSCTKLKQNIFRGIIKMAPSLGIHADVTALCPAAKQFNVIECTTAVLHNWCYSVPAWRVGSTMKAQREDGNRRSVGEKLPQPPRWCRCIHHGAFLLSATFNKLIWLLRARVIHSSPYRRKAQGQMAALGGHRRGFSTDRML